MIHYNFTTDYTGEEFIGMINSPQDWEIVTETENKLEWENGSEKIKHLIERLDRKIFNKIIIFYFWDYIFKHVFIRVMRT